VSAFQSGGKTVENIFQFGPFRMVFWEHGQGFGDDKRIPTEPFAPDLGRESCFWIGPLGFFRFFGPGVQI
jgi:hypothetical protein